jgi:superfamily I DNA/RNA helicase
MIPGQEHVTHITPNENPDEKYTYLFRSWKGLLETAQSIKNIWINDFDKQSKYIRQLSEKLKKYDLTEEERAEFSDDLPYFLLSLGQGELENMLDTIESNMVPKESCTCEMYTIHAYKGLEDDVVKVHDDIDEEETNLSYVALTRGKYQTIER